MSLSLSKRFVKRLLAMQTAALWTAVLLLMPFYLPVAAQSAFTPSGDEAALSAATKVLCNAQVAMLGESATHGDGQTVAFKGALIERLVNQCGFDSVYFEASHYEFIHLNHMLKTGQPAIVKDVLAAVGGLWEFDQEFQSVASFLLVKAKAGQVFLGGLDDQLGQYGQDYANIELISDLTGLLVEPERQECRAALHKRIYSDYLKEMPYTESDRFRLDACLSKIGSAATADRASSTEDMQERQEMISAARRWIQRDFTSNAEMTVKRDRSMFQDFEWLQSRRRKRHKVIVWAATVHVAKQADPIWGDHEGTNLGSFIHKEYGAKTFSLGFSALNGSYRLGGRQIREMPAPPVDSVEVRALQGSSAPAIFVGTAQLAAMGDIPGAFFQHSYENLPWNTFLDGVVVFQSEHPPVDLREKR